MSPQTMNTKAEATTSAKPDATASNEPTPSAATPTETDHYHDQPTTTASTPMLLKKTGELSRKVRNTSITEVFDDPQVQHNQTVLTHHHPAAGQIRTTRFPARFSKTPTELERLAPAKGEHTDEVLAELGHSPAEIAALRDDGIVA